MAETDSIRINQPRFRSSTYPGAVGGSIDPQTGNVVPGIPTGNPNAAASQLPGSALPPKPQTGLANVTVPPAPGFADLAGAVGKSALTFSTTNVGANAGPRIAAGEDFGSAVAGGAQEFGTDVADFGSKVFGGGEAAVASAPAVGGGGARFVPTGEVQALPGTGPGATFGTFEPAAASSGAGAAGGAGAEAGSFGSNLTSASNLGGAAGAGVGTFIVALISGQSPGQAAKSGLASAAGFAIGNAALPGVGGFVGAAVGGIIGGRVICTELVAQGMMDYRLLRHDLWHAAANIDRQTLRGYHFWAFRVVGWMRRPDQIGAIARALALPLATWRARECAFQMGFVDEPCWEGRLIRALGEPICRWIGGRVADSNLLDLYPQHAA